MQSQKFAIITIVAALLLVISTFSTITPYSVIARSNAQTSGANNDCPSDLLSLIIGVQLQTSANCLNDLNSVQDSDGAAISSTPFNAAPSQALDLELEFGDENDGTMPQPTDTDGDGFPDDSDNCPNTPNTDQTDTDGDAIGDACDNCPDTSNPDQTDTNQDGIGDACQTDTDGDTIPDDVDNCPDVVNDDQTDTDGDGIGDACDTTPNGDSDGDGVDNLSDNCPNTPNTDQADSDGNGIGDACEPQPTPCEDCLAPLLDFPGLAIDVAELNIATPGTFSTDAEAIAAICEALENGYPVSIPTTGGGAALDADLVRVLFDHPEVDPVQMTASIIECLNMIFGA